MTDPISILQTLASAVKYLWEVSEKLKENKAECRRLCEHANKFLQVIQEECREGLPHKMTSRLHSLARLIKEIAFEVDNLSKRTRLQRILWRGQISAKIQEAFRNIRTAVEDFQFRALIDIVRMQREHEEARLLDYATIIQYFRSGALNDQEILNQLQVRNRQLQEGMFCIRNHIENPPAEPLPDSERTFLEQGLHAMQRRSGTLRMLPDKYTITSFDVLIYEDRKLGAGGFAEVFEASWRGTRVAVKVLEKGLPSSVLEQEVNAWKDLRHPNILEFYGACPIAEPPFVVCAYKKHGDAIAYLRRHPMADRCALLLQAAQGLAYLHRNNVVHGDLKGNNILIDSHGQACLCDFGLSKVISHTTTIRGPALAGTGTLRWMSPEQMTFGVINTTTDIYSFGMTMYEVFTGIPPFANTSESVLLQLICDRKIRPPRPTDPTIGSYGLDDAVWNLMTECWSHEATKRPPSPELTRMLRQICSYPPEAARVLSSARPESSADAQSFGSKNDSYESPVKLPSASSSQLSFAAPPGQAMYNHWAMPSVPDMDIPRRSRRDSSPRSINHRYRSSHIEVQAPRRARRYSSPSPRRRSSNPESMSSSIERSRYHQHTSPPTSVINLNRVQEVPKKKRFRRWFWLLDW